MAMHTELQIHKTADDFALEAALNRLGFYRREKS